MPDMGIGEILGLVIPAVTGAAGMGVSLYEGSQQRDMAQQQMQMQQRMQQQQQQQAQQQALSTRRQAMMAEGPTLQSQVGGAFTDPQMRAIEASVTGNPAFANYMPGTTGNLTPALEALFPSGSSPSLTEPYPMNV